ncbi:hypothetical protein [Carboxylicivirga sp. M1479]|uniref:hypothetical protein n=1 Tax=Carboxylicivirga sp. M1479 TaxID=2594476 RepID=UPI0011783DE2|nr:hypothetical protein [Carboxylicivirga sp. M1479]TRX66538.1 hypothetical protein FNN09_12800 [Carboxylicivirga sp. M1479]
MSTFKQIIQSPVNVILVVLGVDVRHFWVLLGAKLKMDFRRPPNSFQSGGKKQTLLKQLLVYGVLGGIMVGSLYQIPDLMLQLSVFYAFLIVFAGTILLTEFTSVIFDEHENHVLLPRPVSSRTLLLVRLAHILVYMSNIALALSLPFTIYLAFQHGILALVFVLGVLLCAWFTLLLVVGFYMWLSKLVSVNRFKDVLNYFQIGLAIIIMGSYQLVPHFIDDANMEQLTFQSAWWTNLVPSVWFAGFTQYAGGIGSNLYLFLMTLGVTIFGSILLVRVLSSGFSAIISESGSASSSTKTKSVKLAKTGKWLNKVLNMLCISEEEKTGWRLTKSHIKSDRKLKQQLYPMLAYSLIMVVILLKPDFKSETNYFVELGESSKYLMFMLAAFFGTLGIPIISFTDTPKAAWIYSMASTNKKHHIHSGAVKSLLFTFFLPLYVLFLIPIVIIWGWTTVPLFVLGGLLSTTLAVLLVRIQGDKLPFTQCREMMNKGEYTMKMFLGLMLMGLIIGLVYLVSMAHVGIAIALCVLMPFVISLSYRTIRNSN